MHMYVCIIGVVYVCMQVLCVHVYACLYKHECMQVLRACAYDTYVRMSVRSMHVANSLTDSVSMKEVSEGAGEAGMMLVVFTSSCAFVGSRFCVVRQADRQQTDKQRAEKDVACTWVTDDAVWVLLRAALEVTIEMETLLLFVHC